MDNAIIDILNLIWLKICQFTEFIAQFLGTALKSIPYGLDWAASNNVSIGIWYCHIVRWIMPVLALLILASIIKGMLSVKNPEETWAYLHSQDFGSFPVTHWETLIGRGRTCDVLINHETISKVHCALIFDGKKTWTLHSLTADSNILVNGEDVYKSAAIQRGDEIEIGGIDFAFEPISKKDLEKQTHKREYQSKFSPMVSASLLTVFQMLTVSSLIINRPEHSAAIAISFIILAAVMWFYFIINFLAEKKGLEPEILAFFLCSLSLAITSSSSPATIYKQLAAILIGMVFFLFLGWYLRDLKRIVKTRHLAAIATGVLLVASLVFGTIQHGAQNWIYIAGISVQTSELAKVCFIFAGSATLERLFVKRNLWGFMALSFFCFGALALMSDFGTASIFFVTFLIIAFMRSGDYATISIICCSAAAALGLMLKFKPYIAARFNVWGHAWEFASGAGYQQVRTMSASASGGLIGVGPGNGWLHNVAAANTDLVFGMVCEEWGLIIALLSILAIATLSLFSVRVVKSGRSSYYAIAACAATSMLVFQTILNVFGSVDVLPLTGVTFPFVSCGGSSMLAAWGLLAFVKAADTRQGASFAVKKGKAIPIKKKKKHIVSEPDDELYDLPEDELYGFPEDERYDVPEYNPNESAFPFDRHYDKGIYRNTMKNKQIQNPYTDEYNDYDNYENLKDPSAFFKPNSSEGFVDFDDFESSLLNKDKSNDDITGIYNSDNRKRGGRR